MKEILCLALAHFVVVTVGCAEKDSDGSVDDASAERGAGGASPRGPGSPGTGSAHGGVGGVDPNAGGSSGAPPAAEGLIVQENGLGFCAVDGIILPQEGSTSITGYTGEGFADVGIGVESAPQAQIYNNTIYQEHGYPNAIEYRFPQTAGVLIANNLTNRAITSREGASGTGSASVASSSSTTRRRCTGCSAR